ncbi:hypothetical protein UA08_05866 [Talaromyces atroroseus]|uniref:Uncharacterized protein n=1 Tax=Talaromyces atroroseus TaxID=1441469 RepID=A0A225AUV9_TALAT|nr:hypothetical protein UA08_05866 [Talaromyces atroroseus]OKL58766.1 hypothetical protein UA08_05866 [Talaromyces atroroseus]
MPTFSKTISVINVILLVLEVMGILPLSRNPKLDEKFDEELVEKLTHLQASLEDIISFLKPLEGITQRGVSAQGTQQNPPQETPQITANMTTKNASSQN